MLHVISTDQPIEVLFHLRIVKYVKVSFQKQQFTIQNTYAVKKLMSKVKDDGENM